MAEKQVKSGYKYYKIIIRGTVQGIGFRPFVYSQAKKYGICGTIQNIGGEVKISASVKSDKIGVITDFLESINKNSPPGAFIESITKEPAEPFEADGFEIIESENQSGIGFFPPDTALCEKCRSEIYDAGNIRRKRHYFNTCVTCGPRFSILKRFPYDRINTSMDKFLMCKDCLNEYKSPDNLRFHAETISCIKCGPELFFMRAGSNAIYKGDKAFSEAIADLKINKKIVAIKGIGGYHLACSPYNSETVCRLRLIKGREEKPFALMFKNIDEISKVCEVNPEEKSLLVSKARPIVLLKMKDKKNIFAREVLNSSNGRCGCFLPYTPLQELLLDEMPILIMTSANRSSSPIIKDDEEIKSFALENNISVLYHNRDIVRSVEDSVAQIINKKPHFIRRARGYTPLPVFVENTKNRTLFCAGGDLKSAFGLLKNNAFILSQYIGDLENASVFKQYEENAIDFEKLFDINPQAVVCDAHPRYFSADFGKDKKLPLLKVYHHHAHIASVMAEHKISRVLGVAFDGSGYGEDGNIWGGEFLTCEEGYCRRAGHLNYTKILGADDSAKDAAKTALCYLHSNNIKSEYYENSESQIIKAALDNNINTYLTSSMGRLFDAVASILGICNTNSYEGECATLLQYAAEKEAKSGVIPVSMNFKPDINPENGQIIFDCRDILEKCIEKRAGSALGFHNAICDMITQMCVKMRDYENIRDVALSGGVFQNSFLLENVINRLAVLGFNAFTNEAVPPNDGGIALGQAYIGIRRFEN